VAGGVAGFFGIVLLYRALSAGAMAVAAPITAVTAAVVPMVVGLVTDEVPGLPGLAGAGCAVVAIGLVSLGPAGGRVTKGLIGLALAAGGMFGIFFALLGQAGEESGMWSLAAVRVGSITVGVALMLRTGQSWRLPGKVLPWVAVAGILDTLANAFYVAAAARGNLSVVAPIASLYPASTVLLALFVERERIRAAQLVGLGLAAAALVLASA
jgi:drug/metabolite transporter (DMT)-like permease